MKRPLFKRFGVILLSVATAFTIFGCEIDDRTNVGSYESNENSGINGWGDVSDDNVEGWDNVDVASWDEADDISQWVYAELIFDGITDEYANVTTMVLDYKTNGQYFDGERVYQLVGRKFDLNSLIAKFAIGTGVIVVCVVLNVVTAGSATPVACFIAGAAIGSITSAVKGAAMGAAMGAISSAIQSGGDWKETLYGSLEGASSGYMWGAIFGAISGGLNSNYCFIEETTVMTTSGAKTIAQINKGDYVYSYNEVTQEYSYQKVTQKMIGETYETFKVYTDNDCVESTANHPYYCENGWTAASNLSIGDRILSKDGDYKTVTAIEPVSHDDPVKIYNISIENNHTFMVGDDSLVVHNRCNINSEYSGKNYQLQGDLAKKYPNGVDFSADGYPRFEPYAKKIVSFDYPSKEALARGTCLNGSYNHDAALANKIAGFGNTVQSTPAGYTWHHDESMMRLLLIPQELHKAVRHTGGASLIKALLALLK